MALRPVRGAAYSATPAPSRWSRETSARDRSCDQHDQAQPAAQHGRRFLHRRILCTQSSREVLERNTKVPRHPRSIVAPVYWVEEALVVVRFQTLYELTHPGNCLGQPACRLIATQNPMDLDYRALSNAGVWCIGRLQTDDERERVVDGLGDVGPGATMTKSDVANVIKKLAPRWFLLRDAHAREGMMLLQPRWAISLMLGPMTRTEIKRALAQPRTARPDAAVTPPYEQTLTIQVAE